MSEAPLGSSAGPVDFFWGGDGGVWGWGVGGGREDVERAIEVSLS